MSDSKPSDLVITSTRTYHVEKVTDWRGKRLPQEWFEVRFDTSFQTMVSKTDTTIGEVVGLACQVALQVAADFLKVNPSQLRAHRGVGFDRSIFVEAADGGPLPKPAGLKS